MVYSPIDLIAVNVCASVANAPSSVIVHGASVFLSFRCEVALRTVEGRGIRLVDAHGRPGIHDTCVAFLHPKATMGVLTEFVELAHSDGS